MHRATAFSQPAPRPPKVAATGTCVVLSLLLLLSLASRSDARQLELVVDLDPGIDWAFGSDPRQSLTLERGVVFFTGPRNARALWRTDGTRAGTTRLGPGCPERCVSDLWPVALTSGHLLFGLAEGEALSLWRTDGTPGGTLRIASGVQTKRNDWQSAVARLPSGIALFTASSDAPEQDPAWRLWRSDGTAGGTYELPALDPWVGSVAASRAYFAAFAADAGREIWTSDGTVEGTRPVSELVDGIVCCPLGLVGAVADTGLAILHTDTLVELWAVGPTLARQRRLAVLSSEPYYTNVTRSVADGRSYLRVVHRLSGGSVLWVTDGTRSGTQQLTPSALQVTAVPTQTPTRDLHFVARDGEHGRELWFTDGTAAGTRLALDLCPGVCDGVSSPLASGILFGDDGVHGREPFLSDGTPAGTFLLADVCPGTCSPSLVWLRAFGDRWLAFRHGADGVDLLSIRARRSGLPGRVRSLRRFQPADFGGVLDLRAADRLHFLAADQRHGLELWETDGTRRGTRLFKDFEPRVRGMSSWPHALVDFEGALHFIADDGAGDALWRTTGTAGATELVERLAPADPDRRPPAGSAADRTTTHFYVVQQRRDRGGALWAGDGEQLQRILELPCCGTVELLPSGSRMFVVWQGQVWVSEGTPETTSRLVAEEPSSSRSGSSAALLGPDLVFARRSGLWRSDGTAAGTRLVAPALEVDEVTAIEGGVLFVAHTSQHGTELWFSDGTAAGTRLLADVAPGEASANPRRLVAAGARVFLTASTPEQGEVLLAANGDGVSSLGSVRRGHWDHAQAVLDGTFYFADLDGRLWSSHGTAATTRPSPLLSPGDRVGGLAAAAGELWLFIGVGPSHTLWRTDGTAPPRAVGSDVGATTELVEVNGQLYFSVYTERTGQELHRVALAAE